MLGVHRTCAETAAVSRGTSHVRTKQRRVKPQSVIQSGIIIIMMHIYHALINALSAHMIHINLNMVFYTHVEHSPTKTIYIKYYTQQTTKNALQTHAHTHTHTHTLPVAETGS